MPHTCMRCGQGYADDAPAVMQGCACGSRVFLFVRNGKGAAPQAPAGQGPDTYEIDLSRLLLRAANPPHVRSLPGDTYEIDVGAALSRK